MLQALSDILWRCLLLLLQGCVPKFAPLEVGPATGTLQTILRLLAGLLALSLLGCAAKRAWKTHRVVGGLLGLLGITTLAGSVATLGSLGPLARAAWVLCPLLWLTLATTFAFFVLPKLLSAPSPSHRYAVLGAGALIALLQLLSARARLTSETALLQAALLRDPGQEAAALLLTSKLRAEARNEEACNTVRACAQAPSHPCGCTEPAATCALNKGDHLKVVELLEQSGHHCTWTPARIGLRAEALAGLGRLEDASQEASAALRSDPKEPHALFALSRVAFLKGDSAGALAFARSAVDNGHGLSGHLQYGMLLVQAGDLPKAQKQFEAVLREDPRNASAVFDLALLAHKQGRYRDAREGYLKALQIDPTFADARYNLVLLTHSAGALDEARHHLQKLVTIAPKDPRLPYLQTLLNSPSP